LDQLSAFVVRVHQQAPSITALFDLMDEAGGEHDKAGAKPLDAVAGAVTFAAKAGETIALVGPTGSGKSTTIALLQRFQTPTSGRIAIDGHDIADVTLLSLRRAISVVFQDAGLFNRSIGENIRIGKPDATDAEVERAS